MKENELTLKEIQDASFNVLIKIKEIFEKHNWSFYLAYGTLIGAVRHKGFIPWDDDIDIWVPRDDYEKFVAYCLSNEKELKNFHIINFRSKKKCPHVISRFYDDRFIVDYESYENYSIGVFVDIYPLDEVDADDFKFKNKINLMRKRFARITWKYKKASKNILKRLYAPFVYLRYTSFGIDSLAEKIDRFAQKYNGTNQKYLAVTSWQFMTDPYEKNAIIGEKPKFLLFNGLEMPVPYDYDKILKNQYGDYMKLPPLEERIGHHFYKVFKK